MRLFRPDFALTGNLDPGFSQPPRYVFQRLKIVVTEELKDTGVSCESFPALLVERLTLSPVLQDGPQLDSKRRDLPGGVLQLAHVAEDREFVETYQYRRDRRRLTVTEDYRLSDWQYRKAKKKQKGGVLINLSPSGAVEIREGLVRPKMEKKTAEAIAENPIAPVKVKAAYSAPLCRYIAHHKTAAVAEILLASPRTAQEVLTVRTLGGFRLHEAFPTLGKEAEPQSAYRVLEEQARCFAGKLGFEIEEGESVWGSFPPPFTEELALYEAVRGLSDHVLAGLQTLLAALSFGQGNCDRLDTSDSLFNRVARDLSVDMKNHWRPDAAFFGKRNREQLVGIAKECGYADGPALFAIMPPTSFGRGRSHEKKCE